MHQLPSALCVLLPDMDGQADSGEVVWVWAPSDGKQSPPRERAVLIISRTRTTVLGLLISPTQTMLTKRNGSTSALVNGTNQAASVGFVSTESSRFLRKNAAARARSSRSAVLSALPTVFARVTTGPKSKA